MTIHVHNHIPRLINLSDAAFFKNRKRRSMVLVKRSRIACEIIWRLKG